jgi:hypothetical protein
MAECDHDRYTALMETASAVGLAAARTNGDRHLAESLDHEVEWLALGVTRQNQRTYAAGLLPVTEAFIFWAKTTPLPATDASNPTPVPLWWPWALVFALPALLTAWLTWRSRRKYQT